MLSRMPARHRNGSKFRRGVLRNPPIIGAVIRFFLKSATFGLLISAALKAAETLPGERALQTELKVSGPSVYMRAPVGLRYRPGCLFPLQFRIHNPGAAFSGEVFTVEGANDDGLRSGDFSALGFQTQSSRLVTLPVRAPAVMANLSLVVRGSESEGGVAVQRFRTRLRDLKPLPPDARLILSIGRPGYELRSGVDAVVSQSSAEMLDEFWMYDGVDLVVLRDDVFRESRPAAREALRMFLLGGGRLLLTSDAALQAAAAERLLPFEPGPIGSSLAWWEQNAGLKRSDILAEKDNRPVYCRLRMGLGEVVFRFPATDEVIARDMGQAVFSHPALYRAREKHADWRIQPDRFLAFSYNQVHPGRAGRALLWLGLGALMLCVFLILAVTSRGRLESAGLPVAFAALIVVMLAQWFPEPDLIASRVVWQRQPADGRVSHWQEWKLVESFRRTTEVSAMSPEQGTLSLLVPSAEDLAEAQADLERGDRRLSLDHVWVQPSEPVLLHASRIESATPAAGVELVADSRIKINLPGVLNPGVQKKLMILARANGTLWYIAPNATGYDIRQFDSTLAAVQSSLRVAGDKARARAAALGWATRDALRSKRDVLICWGEAPEEDVKSLVELEPANYEVASSFFMSSMEVRIKE
ncbi:MAG TPA: hypothetical protein VEK08_23830 [Planctomycetota bacterium]|nr:hypothetical protein [Planctomycetota bacterium]